MNAELNKIESITNFLQNKQSREYDLPEGGLKSLVAFCVAQGFVLSRDGYVYNPEQSNSIDATILLEDSYELDMWARDNGLAVYDRRTWRWRKSAQEIKKLAEMFAQ